MFRYVKGTSMNRNKLITKMNGLASQLAEHVIKCVAYGDVTSDYNHWTDVEIAGWIYSISQVTVKPSGKKLKQDDYVNGLFGELGEDVADARLNLELFKIANKRSHEYPDFDVSLELCERLAVAGREISDKFSKIVSETHFLTKDDIQTQLHAILDPICLKA